MPIECCSFFKPVVVSSTRRDLKCIDDKVAHDSTEAAQFLLFILLKLNNYHVLFVVMSFCLLLNFKCRVRGGKSYLFCLYKTKTVTEYAVQC